MRFPSVHRDWAALRRPVLRREGFRPPIKKLNLSRSLFVHLQLRVDLHYSGIQCFGHIYAIANIGEGAANDGFKLAVSNSAGTWISSILCFVGRQTENAQREGSIGFIGFVFGQRMGDFILAPGITDYNKRIQYQTYDVTDLLKAGDNVLTVQLADGWYRGSTGAWGLKNQYGTETALLCQLEITGEDGTIETVCSDETWDWSNDGPIRFADNKDGEIVDANRQPGYGAKAKCTSRTVIPS